MVTHGDIVGDLESHTRSLGLCQKAQAIDLAVIGKNEIHLFEVKSSARTTDIYTGTGQLALHGAAIEELLNLPVRRYLVLPEHPDPDRKRHLHDLLGIRIVTFQQSGKGYIFTGF